MFSTFVLLLALVLAPSVVHLKGIYGAKDCVDAPTCRDMFKNTPVYRQEHFCYQYGMVCKKSCQKCTSDCQDTRGKTYFCHKLRKLGGCRNLKYWQSVNCRRTCNLC